MQTRSKIKRNSEVEMELYLKDLGVAKEFVINEWKNECLHTHTKPVPVALHLFRIVKHLADAGIAANSILQAALVQFNNGRVLGHDEMLQKFGKPTTDLVIEMNSMFYHQHYASLPSEIMPGKVDRLRAKLERSSRLTHGARLVSLATILANLETFINDHPRDWSIEQCQGYFLFMYTCACKMKGTSTYLERKIEEARKRTFYHRPTKTLNSCIKIPEEELTKEEGRVNMALEYYYTIC